MVFALIFSLVFVASCGADEPDPEPDPHSGEVDPHSGEVDPDPHTEVRTFTLTLDVDGGSMSQTSFEVLEGTTYTISAGTIMYGDTSARIETPTKEGYDFEGWYNAGEKVVDGSYTFNSDVTLKANWVAKTFTIKFDLDGGTGASDITVKYQDAYTLPTPTKTGYDFEGWFEGTSKVENGTYTKTSDTELKAKWSAKTFTIKFNLDGGTGASDITVKYQEAYTLPTPTKEGFGFAGWFDGTIKVENGTYTLTSDLTLTAKWEANKYTLTLDVNGGDALSDATQTLKDGDAFTLPTPERLGHKFLGWFNGTEKVESGTYNFKKDVKLVAKWEANKYTLTLDVNGGNALAETTIQVEFGKSFTLPTPEKSGFTFEGWLNGTEKVTSGTWDKTSDLALTASWSVTKYTLTLDPNGGEVETATFELVYGDTFTLPTPKRAGYDFAGWFDGDKEVTSGTWNRTSSLTLKAKWATASFTVKLDVNGGSAIKQTTVNVVYGQSFTLELPKKAGYRFVGWFEEDTLIDALIWEYDHSMNLVAKWEEILPEKIEIDGEKALLELEQSCVLVANVYPLDANVSNITWTSSDETVAKFEDGKLVAKGNGTTVITVQAGAVTDKFTLTVLPITTSLAISGNSATLHIEDSEELTIVVTPDGANNKVTWSFDKEGIVIIDKNNKLTALKGGTVTITATSVTNPNFSESYKLRVYDNVEGMTIKGSGIITVGKSRTYTVDIATKRADNTVIDSNSPIKWSSSDPTVMTIDENTGEAQALKAGTCIITATAQDSGKLQVSLNINVVTTEVFIGTTQYATVSEALLATKGNDTIELGAFTCDEALTISKNNLTIQAAGTTFSNTLTINDGVEGLTIDGATFISNAYINTPSGSVGIKDLTITNCTFTNVANTVGGTVRIAVPVTGFTFTHNTVTAKTDRGVRFETTAKDIDIEYNTFTGTGVYDAVRGYDLVHGDVTISYNVFENTNQSFIMIRYIGNGTYNVENNMFINAKNTCVDLREAKVDGIKATINIKNNVFNGGMLSANTWGAIRVRNSVTTTVGMANPENVEVHINENKFKNIVLNNGDYYVDKPTSACTEGLFDIDKNYSDLGQPEAWWFCNMQKSMDDWYDEPPLLEKINEENEYVVVGSYIGITKQGYATIAEAIAAVPANGIVVLLPGTYTESFTISKSCTIMSLNGDKDLADLERYPEVTYTGTITIAKELTNVAIKGINFTGASQIVNTKGTAGTKDAPTTNLGAFTFINNTVNVTTTGMGFIYFAESGNSYSHNIKINGNSFTTSDGFSASAMVRLDNLYNLEVIGNEFTDIEAPYAFYINDQTKGMSGEYATVEDNTFNKITGSAFWANWVSPMGTTTAKVSICNNIFNTVTEFGVYIGKANNGDQYSYFKIESNKFTKVDTCIYIARVIGTAKFSAKYNVFNDVPKTLFAKNDSANTGATGAVTLDMTDCYYYDGNSNGLFPDSAKFYGAVNYDTTQFTIIDRVNAMDAYVVVGTYTGITKKGYDTITEALAAAPAGSIILITPGEYNENLTISKAITIMSLNGDKGLDALDRYPDVFLTSKITIAKEISSVAFKGIDFVGASQIINTAGTAGTANAPTTNLGAFIFMNNKVSVTTTGKGFIYFTEAGSSYSHNINISHNAFTTQAGFGASAMVWLDNLYNIDLVDNIFADITATYAFYINDQTKGMSGEYATMEHNKFTNITGNALWINWASPLGNTSTAPVSIKYNTFNNVTGQGVHVGKTNASDSYAYLSVDHNEFTKVGTCIYFVRVTSPAKMSARYNVFHDVPTVYVSSEVNNSVTLNATDNLYLDGNGQTITPDNAKFTGSGAINHSTTITKLADLPA